MAITVLEILQSNNFIIFGQNLNFMDEYLGVTRERGNQKEQANDLRGPAMKCYDKLSKGEQTMVNKTRTLLIKK